MRQLAWLLVIAGLGVYLYEAKTNAPILPSIENNLPGNIGLDLLLFAGGIAIFAFG
jgi:hypothetical protein